MYAPVVLVLRQTCEARNKDRSFFVSFFVPFRFYSKKRGTDEKFYFHGMSIKRNRHQRSSGPNFTPAYINPYARPSVPPGRVQSKPPRKPEPHATDAPRPRITLPHSSTTTLAPHSGSRVPSFHGHMMHLQAQGPSGSSGVFSARLTGLGNDLSGLKIPELRDLAGPVWRLLWPRICSKHYYRVRKMAEFPSFVLILLVSVTT